MRHRITCPLYDEHPKHLEVLNHLDRFAKGDRGRELATLAVAGFSALYGQGKSSGPHSLDLDFAEVLRNLLASQGVNSGPPPLRPESRGSQPQVNGEVEDISGSTSVEERSGASGSSDESKNESQVQIPPSVSSDVVVHNPHHGSKPGVTEELLDEDPAILEHEQESLDDDDHIDALSVIGSKFGL